MNTVEIEKAGEIAIFTLNRPEKYNAVNPDMVRALNETMMEFMEEQSLRVGKINGAVEIAYR